MTTPLSGLSPASTTDPVIVAANLADNAAGPGPRPATSSKAADRHTTYDIMRLDIETSPATRADISNTLLERRSRKTLQRRQRAGVSPPIQVAPPSVVVKL